jgi:hypothetical protein
VFDAPLDYNLLLSCNWIDSMHAIVSTLFCVIRFPHQNFSFTIDQLSFFSSDSRTCNFPFIAKMPPSHENVGVGLLKDSLSMGTFPIPPPDSPPPFVASINMTSTTIGKTPESYDPWLVPSFDDYLFYGDIMHLSPVELVYQAIQSTTPSPHSLLYMSPDLFHVVFHTDEMIMTVMSMEDTPWDDGHHHSILFLEPETIESYQ